MASSPLKSRVVKGAFWSIGENVVLQGMTFLIFVLLARLLDPVMFGLLAAALLFNQLFKAVLFDSIATAVISKAEPTEEDYDTAFLLIAALSVPVFLLLVLAADAVESIFATEGLGDVLRGTAVILLFTGSSRIHEAWLTRNLQFRSLALRSTAAVTVGGAVGIGLALAGHGVASLVAQQVAQSLVSLAMLWVVTPWQPRWRGSWGAAMEMYRYGRYVAITGLTNFANQSSDIFFIAYLLGPVAAGIYSAGKRILAAVNAVFAGALQRIALPAFAQVQSDPARMSEAFLQAVGLTATITAPVFAGIACLSSELTLVLLGPKWGEAVPIMTILSATGFLQSLGYYNHSVVLAKGKPHWQTNLTLLYALSNVLVFVIVARHGLIAVALAFTLRSVLLYPLSIGCVFRLLPVNPGEYLRAVSGPVISASIMASGVIAARQALVAAPDWERLVLLVPVGAALYAAAMLVIGREELKRTLSVVQVLLSKKAS